MDNIIEEIKKKMGRWKPDPSEPIILLKDTGIIRDAIVFVASEPRIKTILLLMHRYPEISLREGLLADEEMMRTVREALKRKFWMMVLPELEYDNQATNVMISFLGSMYGLGLMPVKDEELFRVNPKEGFERIRQGLDLRPEISFVPPSKLSPQGMCIVCLECELRDLLQSWIEENERPDFKSSAIFGEGIAFLSGAGGLIKAQYTERHVYGSCFIQSVSPTENSPLIDLLTRLILDKFPRKKIDHLLGKLSGGGSIGY